MISRNPLIPGQSTWKQSETFVLQNKRKEELKLRQYQIAAINYNRVMTPKDPLATSGLPPIKRRENEYDPTDQSRAEPKFLILVADDSADTVTMISLFLQQEGYRVVTASNGEDAIKVAAQTIPNLILMDVSMPTLDGFGATRRIREDPILRDIPIIAVTAFSTEGFQRAAYDVGVSGYLTKPVDLDRMCHLIRRLLSPSGSGNLAP